MRYVYLILFFVVVATVGALGFRGSISTRPPLEVFPDMDRQSKFKTQAGTTFFADGMTDRPIPAGTVARDMVVGDDHLILGRDASGEFVNTFPAAITIDNRLFDRGRERYDIYCSSCHGLAADGKGIVTQYGWGLPANLHDARIREQPHGEIYNTIANGKNTMYPLGDKIDPHDRWAIVAYVRALQRTQNGRMSDVPTSHQGDLN